MKPYKYSITVIPGKLYDRIEIDKTGISRHIKKGTGLKTGEIISNLGAFLNYLDKQ